MNQLLTPFSILAAIGLFLSLIVHLYALLGQRVPFGNLAWGLHVGIFIVWFPAVSLGKRLSKDFKQSELFQAMLRGCPIWMKFYSAAFSILYSASQTEIFDKERRCRNGHVVSPSARFCEDCGAPVAEWRM